MLLVNFKTYKESTGENAIRLAGYLSEASKKFNIEVLACPQLVDLKEVIKILPDSTWGQHADYYERGRATGFAIPEVLKECGANGVVLNHSEHKLTYEILEKIIGRCKAVYLKTLIFVDSIDEALKVSPLKPDWLGYEPPELVASSETSVSRSKPEVIENIVKAIPDIPILVGAGVKDRKDVEVAMSLGAKGIGIASGVILAPDQKSAIEDLCAGFRDRH